MTTLFDEEVTRRLQEEPPDHLFHYTDPNGLIGICHSKQLYAGRAQDMNDQSEQQIAIELTELAISNRLNYPGNPFYITDDRVAKFVRHLTGALYEANRQIYTVSLSSERDVLSQWRAYCPRSGGGALGLPAAHLRRVAEEQDFYLAKCIYDHSEQYTFVDIMLNHTIERYLNALNEENEDIVTPVYSRNHAALLAEYGPLIKHHSFVEEHEWRLVSRPRQINDPKLVYRGSASGIRMYYPFYLFTARKPAFGLGEMATSPGIVVGPNTDSLGAQMAAQSLLNTSFGIGTWHARTESPYR